MQTHSCTLYKMWSELMQEAINRKTTKIEQYECSQIGIQKLHMQYLSQSCFWIPNY